MMGGMDTPGTEEALDAKAEREERWRRDIRLAATNLASGMWAGLLAGFVIGGIGGRLAMFVLRLTSDPSLKGVESDDGFIIGSFTGSTFFLLIFAAILGLVGGMFYLLIREWMPQRVRPVAMGVFGAAVGGSEIVHPDGIDFQELEPASLAIAMFVVIPALYGVAMSLLTERLLRSAEERSKRRLILILASLLPLLALGPFGILVMLVLFGIWSGLWLLNQYVPVGRAWRSEPAAWLGRIALAAIVVLTTIDLVQDSIEIL